MHHGAFYSLKSPNFVLFWLSWTILSDLGEKKNFQNFLEILNFFCKIFIILWYKIKVFEIKTPRKHHSAILSTLKTTLFNAKFCEDFKNMGLQVDKVAERGAF